MPLNERLNEQKDRLVIEAGKAMAKKAFDDALLSPEEKAARAAVDEANRKQTMIKIVVGGVVGLVALVVVLRVMAALWVYAIGAAVLAGIGAVAYFTLQPKLAALQQRRLADAAAAEAARTADERAAAALKAERDAKQKLDDELARLKRQV
ncbi:MAG TPA: hypothetical protein VGF99_08220 [Myxococcota bacterium]